MITSNTLLILGAGASMPYGYPNGRQLSARIVEDARDEAKINLIANVANATTSEVRVFAAALAQSMVASVDEFLNVRKEFIQIGKPAIAMALAPCEETHKGKTENPDGKQHLYEYLWQRLWTTKDKFSGNKLSIITFNYDRSLEWTLFRAAGATWGTAANETREILNSVRIIHAHGRLDPLRSEPNGLRDYGEPLQPDTLKIAASDLRLFHEEGDAAVQEALWVRIQAATDVIFLGFGYHDMNMTRLGIRRVKNEKMQGSCMGITPAEVASLMQRWPVALHDPNLDCLMYLRGCAQFQAAAVDRSADFG